MVFKAETDRKSKRRQQDSNLRPQRGTDSENIRICRRDRLAIASTARHGYYFYFKWLPWFSAHASVYIKKSDITDILSNF